jgi:hypothetical protein
MGAAFAGAAFAGRAGGLPPLAAAPFAPPALEGTGFFAAGRALAGVGLRAGFAFAGEGLAAGFDFFVALLGALFLRALAIVLTSLNPRSGAGAPRPSFRFSRY